MRGTFVFFSCKGQLLSRSYLNESLFECKVNYMHRKNKGCKTFQHYWLLWHIFVDVCTRFACAFRKKTNKSNFEAIAGCFGNQTINGTCTIKTFTYIGTGLNRNNYMEGSGSATIK